MTLKGANTALTDFEKLVSSVLAVPKNEVEDAEKKRPKRSSPKKRKKTA